MQVELHRHLDVSLRLSTLLELAQKKGLVPQSTSLDFFRKDIVISRPLGDLRSVLGTFTLFQKVLDSSEVLRRVAFEAVEDCKNEGTGLVEFRFSPSFVSEFSELGWDDVLTGFESGVTDALKKYPEMKVGLICIATRDYGIDSVDETVDFFLKNKKRLVGLDLAGNEEDFPCRIFEQPFKRAKKEGARITVHAGEAAGPQNIWEALGILGAERIGHGLHCIEDPKLVEHLAKKRIPLEMCPTSNWLTHAVASIEDHPLPQILRAGIPATINTDDPAVFGVTVSDEIRNCREKMGLTDAELALCQKNAFEGSFLTQKPK